MRAVLVALMLTVCSLAACDVGSVLNAAPDGGGGGTGSGSNGCINQASPPTAHVHTAGGASNAGQTCIAVGCHLAGSLGTGANAFAFAGTLYTTTAATTPVTGATIEVVTGGATVTAISDPDGNFYGTGAVNFPANTLATSCPSLRPMIGQLTTGGGNCNNCHRAGGTTTPMTLP